MREVVVVGAARTPLVRYRGEFAALSVPKLGSYPIKEVIRRAGINPAEVEEVIFGNLFGSDWGNPARLCALEAGLPVSVPGLTVDRQSASALNALALAAAMIASGGADVMVAGGVENCSRRPQYMMWPDAACPSAMNYTGYKTAIPAAGGDGMLICAAERLAARYGVTREECDAFALCSRHKAARSWESGYFDDQVVPVAIPRRRGAVALVHRDTGVPLGMPEELVWPCLGASGEGLVTVGNSAPMADGAAAMLLMSRTRADALGLEPLCVVKEYAAAGCDPATPGLGPVHATRALMARHGYTLEDFDLIEFNEGFAAQTLACIRELGVDMERVNVEGGAIALGHAHGAAGAVLAARMAYSLRRRGVRRGLITFCCNGGQGFSLVLENPGA